MPRQITLSERPAIVFGVFNRYHHLVQPTDSQNDHYYQPYTPGWKIQPYYGYSTGGIYSTRAEAQRLLEPAISRWQQRVLAEKRQALTMGDVLVDRVIQRIDLGGWGPRFYFMDGTHVQLERTRGYRSPTMVGPTEGPFLIKRILATYRTFRLEDGRSLVFDAKLQLRTETVPQSIIDQVFSV